MGNHFLFFLTESLLLDITTSRHEALWIIYNICDLKRQFLLLAQFDFLQLFLNIFPYLADISQFLVIPVFRNEVHDEALGCVVSVLYFVVLKNPFLISLDNLMAIYLFSI